MKNSSKTTHAHFYMSRSSFAVIIAITIIAILSCKVRFSMNGSSINYAETKTIAVEKFPIRCAYVWAPMESMFYNSLSDAYSNKTKLMVLQRDGDLHVAGEITEYSQLNKSISSDGYSAQTQLKMTVNVRFTNNANHNEDFERTFSSTAEYDSSLQLNAVQDELVQQMINDIVDQIFNATVANW